MSILNILRFLIKDQNKEDHKMILLSWFEQNSDVILKDYPDSIDRINQIKRMIAGSQDVESLLNK